ncbi:MAG: hypothetical protein ACLRMZ_20140 [Blautia marasmi]
MRNEKEMVSYRLLSVCGPCSGAPFWQGEEGKEVRETEEEQKKQIYVLCAYETKLHQQILNEVAEYYSKRSGCAEVHMEFIPKENFKKEICLRMDNGKTADLIICDNGMMPALIDMGVFADISAYVEEQCQDSMNFQKLWNTTMDDGKYYGIPLPATPMYCFTTGCLYGERSVRSERLGRAFRYLQPCRTVLGQVRSAAKRPEEIYAYRALLYACGEP